MDGPEVGYPISSIWQGKVNGTKWGPGEATTQAVPDSSSRSLRWTGSLG